MKVGAAAFCSLLCAALLLPGCGSEGDVSLDERPAEEILVVGGSESVIPILKSLADGFEADKPGRKIEFGAPGHTGSGILGVARGTFHVGAISRGLKPDEKELGLEEVWFAKDALVFVTHPSVALEGLSADEIRALYYGTVQSWKELGGPDAPVVVLDRPDDTSPKVLLRTSGVFDAGKHTTGGAITLTRPNEMDLALISTPYSIGYTSMASISRSNLELNVLALDGVEPTPGNLQKGDYVLARPQGVVVPGETFGALEEFVDFMFGEEGRAILVRRGYAPLDREP